MTCFILQEKFSQVLWVIPRWILQEDILSLQSIRLNKKIKKWKGEHQRALIKDLCSNKEKQYLKKNRKISTDTGHLKKINLLFFSKKNPKNTHAHANKKKINQFLIILSIDQSRDLSIQ